jgi:hypothetical protein
MENAALVRERKLDTGGGRFFRKLGLVIPESSVRQGEKAGY